MNETFYNQPNLLLDQIEDNDEIIINEGESGYLETHGFPEEMEKESIQLHQVKVAATMKEVYLNEKERNK